MSKLQGFAVLEDSTNASTISDNISREKTSSSKMSPKVTRTSTTSAKQIREVRPVLNSKNLIPDCHAQTLQTINGFECFVSSILSDPLAKIHTVTESESEN
jgi:hypothetical protein